MIKKVNDLTMNDAPSKWWDEDAAQSIEVANALTNTVKLIRQTTHGVQYMNIMNMRLYGGLQSVSGLTFGTSLVSLAGLGNSYGSYGANQETPAYNLIYSCTETVVSRVIKSKPRARFLTNGGSYSLQKKGELLQTLVDGVFYNCELYRSGEKVLRNSCIFGTGVLKIYEGVDGNIICENAFPGDIWVSKLESLGSSPRSLYQTKLMDRFMLMNMFPENAEELLKAQAYTLPNVGNNETSLTKNLLLVNEGWHLKSGMDAEDGRHCMSVSDILLVDENYELDDFPFVFLRFSENALGFWGRGVSELLTGHQMQLNRILRTEAFSHALMSVPRVWTEASSEVNAVALQSNIPYVGKYIGTPPIAMTWPATSENYVQYKEWVIDSAYQFLGISELSSQAVKPPGVDSGVAIRELLDTESDRWTSLGEAYQNFYMDVTKKIVQLARSIKGFKVQSSNGMFLKTIKWSDIDLKDDDFFLQIYPTSQLPQTPAGRLSFVQELAQAQYIDQDTALDLLNIPDLDDYMSLRNAAIERIKQIIELIIENEEYTPPDEMDNLVLGMRMVQEAYQKGLTQDISQKSLKLLRKWYSDAKVLITPPAPAQANGPSPASPAGPLARGPLPPVSDLIPNRT